MSEELKKLIEEQGRAFDEFKKANDTRLNEMAAKGAADPVLLEKTEKLSTLLGDIQDRIDELEKKAKRPGDAGPGSEAADEYKKAFGEFVRKGRTEDLEELRVKAGQIGTNEDGGYAIPEDLDRTILTLMKDTSPMRQVCSAMSIGGTTYRKLVDLGGTTSGWVGETDTRTETSTPKFTEISPVIGEIYANPANTQTMLDDVFFNAEAWLTGAVAEEFAKQEGIAFLSGDGANKPKGILSYPSAAVKDGTRPFGTIEQIAPATAGAIAGDDLINAIYGLKPQHRGNAVWMLNRKTVATIRKLKDAEGNYIWQPGLQQGQPSSLMGYGITENEDMADLAAGKIAVIFGDFRRAYVIVDRMGIRTLRDPYTHKPYVHFYTTKRVGGMLQDSEAIKLLG